MGLCFQWRLKKPKFYCKSLLFFVFFETCLGSAKKSLCKLCRNCRGTFCSMEKENAMDNQKNRQPTTKNYAQELEIYHTTKHLLHFSITFFFRHFFPRAPWLHQQRPEKLKRPPDRAPAFYYEIPTEIFGVAKLCHLKQKGFIYIAVESFKGIWVWQLKQPLHLIIWIHMCVFNGQQFGYFNIPTGLHGFGKLEGIEPPDRHLRVGIGMHKNYPILTEKTINQQAFKSPKEDYNI